MVEIVCKCGRQYQNWLELYDHLCMNGFKICKEDEDMEGLAGGRKGRAFLSKEGEKSI